MLDLSQIAAITIFVAMFAVIVSGKVDRFIPAIIGGILTIGIVFLGILQSTEPVLNVLSLGQLGQSWFWLPGAHCAESTCGINWQTIIFIGGMMVMVEGMGEVGFFRWLCLLVAKWVNYKIVPILITFMLLSGFLSMFIDSITVLLFLATVTIELARMLKFDPVPLIIAEIFAANVGGSATMCGDPPNIIIGTALGYTFTDFVLNTGIIAWIGMAAALVFFYFAFRKKLTTSDGSSAMAAIRYPNPAEAILERGSFMIQTIIFLLVVVLLITHAHIIAAPGKFLHIIKRVDWRTLVFFIGLFICVGGLEETGVLKMLAEYIGDISGGSMVLVIPIVLWVSAFASAIIDNIPFAATMVPVIVNLSQTYGLSLPTLSWTLALGTDIGGTATPIGASANVVGTAIAEREGYAISWGKFMKYSLPAMIIVVALCYGYLIIRYV